MATPELTLAGVLSDFTKATEAALQSLPDATSLVPPTNGITLLDAKNEIFLSYLQALALRNLNIIRSLQEGASTQESQKLSDEITKKLVEHRVYFDRGVRSLEQKIKYQVDKVVKAATDEDDTQRRREAVKDNRRRRSSSSDEGKDEDENDSSVNSDSDSVSDEDQPTTAATAYRPNAAGFARPSHADDPDLARRSRGKEDGIYRPPRVSATVMPSAANARGSKEHRKPSRSATLDEYIQTEYSGAPAAEPSIGSTIAAGGRKNKDAKQMARENERREYEETNLIRLPKEAKKKERGGGERNGGVGFGGEEWSGLGRSAERIGDLTRRGDRGRSALDKSRKRAKTEDGPRDDGIGDAFERRKRKVMRRR